MSVTVKIDQQLCQCVPAMSHQGHNNSIKSTLKRLMTSFCAKDYSSYACYGTFQQS